MYGGEFIQVEDGRYRNKKFELNIKPFVRETSLSFRFTVEYISWFWKSKAYDEIGKISRKFTFFKISDTSMEAIVNGYRKTVELARDVFGVRYELSEKTREEMLHPPAVVCIDFESMEKDACLDLIKAACGKTTIDDAKKAIGKIKDMRMKQNKTEFDTINHFFTYIAGRYSNEIELLLNGDNDKLYRLISKVF